MTQLLQRAAKTDWRQFWKLNFIFHIFLFSLLLSVLKRYQIWMSVFLISAKGHISLANWVAMANITNWLIITIFVKTINYNKTILNYVKVIKFPIKWLLKFVQCHAKDLQGTSKLHRGVHSYSFGRCMKMGWLLVSLVVLSHKVLFIPCCHFHKWPGPNPVLTVLIGPL